MELSAEIIEKIVELIDLFYGKIFEKVFRRFIDKIKLIEHVQAGFGDGEIHAAAVAGTDFPLYQLFLNELVYDPRGIAHAV